MNASIVESREIFKAAIAKNAASVILAHNHPSGDPTPSTEDIAITIRVVHAGDNIKVFEVIPVKKKATESKRIAEGV